MVAFTIVAKLPSHSVGLSQPTTLEAWTAAHDLRSNGHAVTVLDENGDAVPLEALRLKAKRRRTNTDARSG